MAVIVIEDWMIEEEHLSGTSLLAFALIHGCTQKGEGCWFGGYDKLAERIGCLRQAAILAVKKLTAGGYISKTTANIDGRERSVLRSNRGVKITQDVCENHTGKGVKITHEKNIKENIKETSTKVDAKKDELRLPFSSLKFLSVWDTLSHEPKWRKKTTHALQMSLDKLSKYDEEFAIMLMEESIEKGWQGVVFDETPARYEKWKSRMASSPEGKKEGFTLNADGSRTYSSGFTIA